MNYTLHNHIYLCKHASGSVDDMINEAIKHQFDIIGISDHIAYEHAETRYRMDYDERFLYFDMLKKAKDKYKDKIKVLAGFEAEYQVTYLDYLKQLFINKVIDYLILGQHYQDVSRLNTYYGRCRCVEEIKEYVDDCIDAMKTGLFLILVHPDLCLMSIYDLNEDIIKELNRLIDASIQYDVYLEYNCGGMRHSILNGYSQKDYIYPRYEFWQLVKAKNAKVVVGSDAHSPSKLKDDVYDLACLQVKELGLNIVEDIDFDKYQKRVNRYINNDQ